MGKNFRYLISFFICLFWYSTCQAIEVSENATAPGPKLVTLPGKATTAAPTWTDGRTVPLSVDTSGNLRVTGSMSGRVLTASTAYITGAPGGATTKIITGNAGSIKVYGFAFDTTVAGTIYWVYGTGTNCGTGTTRLTANYSMRASTFTVGPSLMPIFVVPANNDLCIIGLSGSGIDATVQYIRE